MIKKLLFFLLALLIFLSLSGFKDQDNSITVMSQSELQRLDPRLHDLFKNKTAAQLRSASAETNSFLAQSTSITVNDNGAVAYGVIIRTDNPEALKNSGVPVNSVIPGFVTAHLAPLQMIDAVRLAETLYITIGSVCYPKNDVAAGEIGADLLHNSYLNNTEFKGSGVLVCIVDTGIDWEHPDFRDPSDPTRSRILYIWDQTLTKTGGEVTPQDRDGVNFAGLNYGVEYSQTDIENEIDGSPTGLVRETDTNGHGTHVAGSAAGNGAAYSTKSFAGMAPQADIIVVKAGNGSFPATNTINALTWAQKMSETLNKPVVVNMSLGGHSSAHDGTGAKEIAVDNFTGAGRVAVISSGNEGSDLIHFSGTVPGSGNANVTITIPSYTPNADANNDYFGVDIWYDDFTNASLTIDSPNLAPFTANSGQSGTYGTTTDGSIYYYNDADGGYTNGDRRNYIYVSDVTAADEPASGTWTLTLTNNTASAVDYHGWLFTHSMTVNITGANSNYTVGDPGTASGAITVGAHTSRWRWSNSTASGYNYTGTETSDDLAGFSSIGPRRDDVQKPDISAPGMGIFSSLSQDCTPSASRVAPGNQHHFNQGTSMSCPIVTGAVALLLEANPYLTASEAKSLITSTAATDSYTGGSLPDYGWGYGKLDIFKAAAKLQDSGTTLDREILAYDGWSSSNAISIGANVKIAVKFTPAISGNVTGVFIHPYIGCTITSPLYVEVWSDNGGLPNANLGSTVAFSQNEILPYSWNFIDLTATGVDVTAATNYHVVAYYTSGTDFFIFYDDGSVDNRSSVETGGGWFTWDGGDFRIRPVVTSDENVLLAAKVFLQGPYNTVSDEMTTALNGSDIPTTSPYSQDARTVSSVPANVTDWVLVQLRSTIDGAAVVSHSAFLNKDGRIVADNGTSGDVPLDVDAGNYYIVVQHRNHVAVMSDETHALSTGSATQYDFTTGLDKYRANEAALLETGVYGMFSGDSDASGTVDATDRVNTWNNRNATGYQNSDCDLSGTVDANDRTATWNNRNTSTNIQ